MASNGFIDYTLNVCRDVSDILHIMSYLLLVIIATLYAFYKFDDKAYQKHINTPILKLILKKNPKLVDTYIIHYINFSNRCKSGHWDSMSTRIPYSAKCLKNFIVDAIKTFK